MGILDRSEPRDGYTVRVLAIHTTEGTSYTAAQLRDAGWWVGSSHAIADDRTLLTPAQGCVPYDRAAWTLRSGNRWSENIEQVALAGWSRAQWLAHPGLLENTARWLADRSKARGIPLVKISAAQYRAGASGVIGHIDHTNGYADGTHWDPGPGYPYDVVIARAKQLAANPEDDMPLTSAEKNEIAELTVAKLLAADVSEAYAGTQSLKNVLSQVWTASRDSSDTDAILAAVKKLPAEVRAALADAIVQVDVSVAGQQPPPAA